LYVVDKLFINHVLRSKPENLDAEIRLREVEWEDVDWIYLALGMKNWELGDCKHDNWVIFIVAPCMLII